MRVIKPLQQGLLFRTLVKDKRYYLAVASLNYFPFHNPTALGMEMEMWETISNSLYPGAIFDPCIPKVQSEVFMVGKCYAPGGKPAKRLFVDLDIGPIIKRVVVTGNRFWKRGERQEGLFSRVVGSDWEMSEPEPFTEMDIGWKNAFGGEGYAENPMGKGYLPTGMSPSLDHTNPLPNIERPEWMVSAPNSIADPAGYGPIDIAWPQRAGKYGKKYDKKWERERYPEPAVDMDPTYYNAAPMDQQLKRVFFEGDERFVITHMHPDKARLESRLPQVRPRCFTLQTGGKRERWREIGLHPETVWLFPNIERGVMIYRGLIEIDTFYGVDVDVLLLAWELKNGRTRSAEDYRKSVSLRLNEETEDDWLVREDDLSPPEGIPEEEPIFVKADDAPLDFGPLVEREKKEFNSYIQQVKDQLTAAGLDPSTYLSGVSFPQITLPNPPKLEKLSDVPKVLEWFKSEEAKLEADAKKIQKQSKFYGKTKEEVRAKVEAKAREICKATGHDYDEIMAKQSKPLSTQEAFKKVTKGLQDTKNEIADMSVPDGKIGGISKAEQLAKFDDMLSTTEEMKEKLEAALNDPRIKEAELAVGHAADPPEKPSAETLGKRRDWVVQRYEAGEGCEDADLSWVDLSHLSLSGLNLKGAKLDSACLVGTDLSGADFSKAILARADFSNAILTTAKFNGANLGKGVFSGADLTGATLEDVTLEDSFFTKSKMTDVCISTDMCADSNFQKADLSHATLVEFDCVDTDFCSAVFVGANLTKASFTGCKMVGADFSRANLQETSFTEVNAAYTKFEQAEMKDTSIHLDSDFSNTTFSHIKSDGLNFSQTKMIDAIFTFAILKEADFGESTLVRANLKQVIARDASFTDADLTDANLHGADLMNASLQSAILRRADFTDAHLFGADLLFAQMDETIFSGAVVKRTLLDESGS